VFISDVDIVMKRHVSLRMKDTESVRYVWMNIGGFYKGRRIMSRGVVMTKYSKITLWKS